MILIGEKLNGSIPIVGEAIAKRDAEFLRQRAQMQAQAGADYLDVCASVSVDIEVETLQYLVELVESVAGDTPICLDSPSPEALLAAMKFCKRPGLINSVSMEGDKIDRIFPAIANSDWQCIALLCDDSGIPDSAEKRLTVLESIMERARAFGIPENKLYIDPLVSALCADPSAQVLFSECAREIRKRYPDVHIVSGLSNISFGLPQRKTINQAFLVLAMQSGMDSAILDPTNRDMRAMIHATEALLGLDESGLNYIAYLNSLDAGQDSERKTSSSDGTPGSSTANTTPSPDAAAPVATPQNAAVSAAFSAVEQGKSTEIEEIIRQAVAEGVDAGAILNDGMIAAMTVIGERFSRGEIFMPEMLVSARVMKKGVAALKPYLALDATSTCGKAVLGTVAGDLHDIGKNLVGMMFESAGFELIDLGVDVSPEAFAQAVAEHPGVRIVGLSSLLTTSLPAMQETVRILSGLDNRSDFFIMVGGAPVTQAFADQIGADAYTEDAGAAAAKARALVGA